MKTFSQIKIEAGRGDYARVAELVGCSRKMVSLVVNEQRTDNLNIQKIFSMYLAMKKETARVSKGITKLTRREAA